MGVHERLSALRHERGLTQDEFANRVGVSKNTQTRYERGHRFPDTEYLQRVAASFGVDLNWLVSGHQATALEQKEYTPDELDALIRQFTYTFGMSFDDFKDLLSWLQHYGQRSRLNKDEQSLLNAYRSTNYQGKRALEAVAVVVAREGQGDVVAPDTWSAAAMAGALNTILERHSAQSTKKPR